ncbi:RteC domain-containing protein [Chryseobacterium sp. HR92]|uniref:RteC domain-containing protein n=1 Tax=Chryseobacterium sp. HR92 TaxID=3094839 RepID=UPI00388F33B6|nr:RteC domain-containing protein [Chryseobacterium sp. HR92]
METQLFFKKCEKLLALLDKKLDRIKFENSEDRIGCCEKSLMEIDIAIRDIKSMVIVLEFSAAGDEIYFFKELKPLFISRFIYYSRLLSIEAAKPNAGKLSIKEYYHCELEVIKDFYQEHIDFYEYYRRKAAFLDHKYFVRSQFDLKTKLESGLYNYDEKFATSHDHLVAQILANDRLEKYLLKSISEAEGYVFEKINDQSPLDWSSSKSGLVELLYALHQTRCFNGGNIEFSEVVRFTERSLNVSLGNFYKTLHEIKNRKINRTKFLQLLNDNLNQAFLDSDR